MSEIGNYKSQYSDSNSSHPMNISSLEFYYSQVNWSPTIEKELIELKIPVRKVENNSIFANKISCFCVGILTILSISMCVQADSIIQSLREVARISTLQIIRINNQ